MTDRKNPRANDSLDTLLPSQMAAKAEQAGFCKANMDLLTMFMLAFLAGAFIALGAVFATTVAAGADDQLPYGVTRLLIGLAFSLGLILVIVGGAELFTGNNLIVMAWASRKVSTVLLVRNWGVVYAGNFLGAVATAAVVYLSGQFTHQGGAIGSTALSVALAKVQLGSVEAVALGAMCNVLVCLSVWLTYSARTTVDRVVAIVPPITAFVACGFEHCVANMYFIPVALLIKSGAPDTFWIGVDKSPDAFSDLTWASFLVTNLLPVTIGNVIGGAVMVGGVYWWIYLRRRSPPA